MVFFHLRPSQSHQGVLVFGAFKNKNFQVSFELEANKILIKN